MVYRPSLEAIDENHPTEPADPYGVSKLAQEMMALRASGVTVLIARPFNHVGPRQAPSYATSSFARQIAEIETGIREPVLHVGNLDARRDLTDVRDTVRAYRSLVERGRSSRPYNVCTGRAYRVGDMLEVLLGLSKVKVATRVDPRLLRPADNPIILGSRARIEAETGWTPEIPIERSLSDLLDYWRGEIARHEAPGA
jgi:GDP-4-dehydro-6-deoxy-D-mannose reductase